MKLLPSAGRILAGALLALLLVATPTLSQEKNVPQAPDPAHASLAAYPNAVIALNDAQTGMLFYVEGDGQTLVAFDKAGAVAWRINVLQQTGVKPALGQPVLRHLALRDGALWVTFGKSDTAKVEPATGKTEYVGSD